MTDFNLFNQVKVLAIAVTCAGCSIYPLSTDVTSYESRDIVENSRCHAKYGIQEVFLFTLRNYPADFIIYDGMTGSQFADLLQSNRQEFNKIKLNKFTPPARSLFTYYGRTLVAYDFTIDSQENNSSGVDALFLKKLTRGSDNIGFKFGSDLTREVKRQNRNYDTFDSLLRLKPEEDCKKYQSAGNILYPSTGLLKISSFIFDFALQNQKQNLGSKEKGSNTAEMNETITFTTKFSGNLTPSFSSDAIPGQYVPSQLKLSTDNYRLDTHTIIIVLSLPLKQGDNISFDSIGRITASDESILSEKLDNVRVNNYFDAQNKASLAFQRNN